LIIALGFITSSLEKRSSSSLEKSIFITSDILGRGRGIRFYLFYLPLS
jgi:hypothetical protein